MTPQSFFPPEISKLLEELGCESQFEYWWHYYNDDEEEPEEWWQLEYVQDTEDKYHKFYVYRKAFHFSDLLTKQNAILVFGEEIEKTIIHPNSELSSRTRIFGWHYHIHHLLDLYNSGGGWENYVKQFLTK